jgi:hypothetical protein
MRAIGCVVTMWLAVGCGDDGAHHLADAPSSENRAPEITSSPPSSPVTVVTSTVSSFTPIELTPADVGSTSASVFSTLPTANPAAFGLAGSDVRKVNFDTTPAGASIASDTTLTDQYAALGVTMENVRVSNSVFGGPASAPNATTTPAQAGVAQRFVFSVNVVAVGIVNTSPDQDTFEFYDKADQLIFSTRDQNGAGAPDFNIDRFVGARTNNDRLIAAMELVNASGNMELDELVFEVSDSQLAHADFMYPVVVTDLDGDSLTYTLTVAPAGATVDADGVVRWRATSADAGTHAFTVRVEDGRGGAVEQSFMVMVVVT